MSVRGERVVYKERDWEEPRKTYTTIKRYQVPESSSRSVYRVDDEDDVREDKIIIRRETRRESSPARDDTLKVTERTRERSRTPAREEVDYRYSERHSERSRDPPRRDVAYRVIERESDYDRPSAARSVVRGSSPPSPERVREFRFERERDFSPPHRSDPPYELERYSKSTEYFAQPQPQPIIIRESAPQPIIIREERREPQKIIIRREEPQYEFVEREESKTEEKSLVKREEPPPPAPVPPPALEHPKQDQQQEEDYFYERRVIERKGRRDEKSEVRPRDSASQYSSDDSYEYVRRERTYDDDRDHSPHHKRHLAEGALAGIAAGQILRHHKKAQGEKPPGRGRSVLGGAALGAVGAEALSRVRSMSRRRSRSRSRSRSGSRDRRRRKHRSRSRSKSLTRVQQLGGLAAVAAVAGLAGYALNKRGNKETVVINDRPRRSRSRRRRASVDTYDPNEKGREALDPAHRNRRIAQAGLASAAAAGLWERVRSKSRGAKGKGKSRERSRIRQGVPIAAAGLGGAALAGLYEKNKANKEAKKEAIIEDELHRGRRRRSRSRSRSVPAPYADDRSREMDERDRGLIAYGNEPIHPDSRRGYYSDEEPGMYRRRHGGGSDGSSPDTRRRRSRSRSRHRWGETGAAAGTAAIAAHEVGRRRERSRQRQDQYAYDPYGHDRGDMYSPSPMQHDPYAQPSYQAPQTYPSSTYFPPPPTGDPMPVGNPHQTGQQNPYPAYNPADYAAGANAQPYGQPAYGGYGGHDATAGAPRSGDQHGQDAHIGHGPERGEGQERAAGRDPENVSEPTWLPEESEPQDADGLNSPHRRRSTSRVKFDTSRNTEHSPEAARKTDGSSEQNEIGNERAVDDDASPDARHQRRRRRRHRNEEPSEPLRATNESNERETADDDSVEELPPRFDAQGNRTDGNTDPLADRINALLDGGGGGGIGGIFRSLSIGGGDDGEGGRRRRSRR